MEMTVSVVTRTNMTNLKHNNRELSEQQKLQPAHSHIQYQTSNLNRYLVHEDLREVYHKLFDESLRAYNDSQKRSDRKIEDFYRHVQKTETLDLQREFIFTLGSKFEWDQLPFEKKRQAVDLLAEFVDEFKQRHPNLYVFNAVVHIDEKGAPHAHVNVVPVATGYKRGLKCKPSFSKALAQEGYKHTGKHQMREFKDNESAELEKKLNQLGIKRKYVGKRNIKDMHEYKELMAQINQEVATEKFHLHNELEKSKERLQTDIDYLENKVSQLESKADEVRVLDKKIEFKQKIIQELDNELDEYAMKAKQIDDKTVIRLNQLKVDDIDKLIYKNKLLKEKVDHYEKSENKFSRLFSEIKEAVEGAGLFNVFKVVEFVKSLVANFRVPEFESKLDDFKIFKDKLSKAELQQKQENRFYQKAREAQQAYDKGYSQNEYVEQGWSRK